MQPLKLRVYGSFYDSQIYSGRLYLWTTQGSIVIVDWDRFIEELSIPNHLRIALIAGFKQGEYLYGEHWKLFFGDESIRLIIEEKFNELATYPLEFSFSDLQKYQIREQDNPLPFPHSDSLIYSNTLFIGSRSGVHSTNIDKRRKNPIGKHPDMLWEGPALSISASYRTLAISAGDEGLYQRFLGNGYNNSNASNNNNFIHKIIDQHSSLCRWLYASIFSSSSVGASYLAEFIYQRNESDIDSSRRHLEKIHNSLEFLPNEDFSDLEFVWGLHDKLCYATSKSIHIVKYAPFKEPNERFIIFGSVRAIRESKINTIITADSSLFGYILEYENGLLVIYGPDESFWINGEPVNWRVFPRSVFYTNHLHVINDEAITIFSFNHDYFVNQETKKVGIRHSAYPVRRTYRPSIPF